MARPLSQPHRQLVPPPLVLPPGGIFSLPKKRKQALAFKPAGERTRPIVHLSHAFLVLRIARTRHEGVTRTLERSSDHGCLAHPLLHDPQNVRET